MAALMWNAANRFRSGFSMLEMLVVVACLAIIAILVVPTADSNGAATLRMAASLVIADLEYAQSASMGNGEDPCVVVFHAAANEYSIVRRSDPAAPITDPGSQHPYINRFGHGRALHLAGVTIDKIEVGGDDQLGFTEFGGLDQGTKATITLRLSQSTLEISVDAVTGAASIE